MTTLLPILGRYGTTQAATQMLQGQFTPPPHLDYYTKKLLREFAIPPRLHSTPKISLHFNANDYITG